MRIQQALGTVSLSILGAVLLGGLFAVAHGDAVENTVAGEQERSVKQAEVPAAALATLKKLAGQAPFTEFAEEVEHGNTFYEGSWNGANGNVDALVTIAGDLVEIEEIIPADDAPAAVRAEAAKAAGKGARLTFEKKTLILYEIHYGTAGQASERIFTPDGRTFHEEGAEEGEGEEEEEEGD